MEEMRKNQDGLNILDGISIALVTIENEGL